MSELLIALFRFLNPWLAYFEAPSVDLERPFNAGCYICGSREHGYCIIMTREPLVVSCTGYPDCPMDGTVCHFELEHGVNCDTAASGVRMPE